MKDLDIGDLLVFNIREYLIWGGIIVEISLMSRGRSALDDLISIDYYVHTGAVHRFIHSRKWFLERRP